MLLKDKTVIVTGGSRGIGAAIAVASARHGANVVINYWGYNDAGYGKRRAIDGVVAEIEAAGRQAIAVEGNVADPRTGKELVAAAVEAFGSVDVLASNAGICPFHSFLDMPPDVMARTMEVNLHGAFLVTQAAANRMKEQGKGGAIVATSSISALVGGGMQTHYTPTKAGVHALMQSCAIALGPYGIRCNSVMPGAILTDLNKDDLEQPEKRDYFSRRIPIGRYGEPGDVADCVVFLASDMARYVTGAGLLVDGGMFVNLQMSCIMETIAFRMTLNRRKAEEYKRRHDAIWPELSALLKASGVADYSIWLDEDTYHLFAVLKRDERHTMDALPSNEIVRRWWDHMADIMEVEPDNTPVQVPLKRMFMLE